MARGRAVPHQGARPHEARTFAWTPCIGPILGRILALAGSRDSVGEGMQMLAVYSLGLGVLVLLTSLAIVRFFSVAARTRVTTPRRWT